MILKVGVSLVIVLYWASPHEDEKGAPTEDGGP